jgi:hypothetical protein
MPHPAPTHETLHPHRGTMTDPDSTSHETWNQPRGHMPMEHTPVDEPIPETVRMITPHDAERAALTGIACGLGLDELRVLVRIGERLQAGRRAYGRLRLETDDRSFRSKEAREELEDALVYLACAWLKAETREVA